MFTTTCKRLWRAGGLCLLLCIGGCLEASETPNQSTWNFEDGVLNERPAGWTLTATNPTAGLARWRVQTDGSAPSGWQVLALTHSDNYNGTFNLAIADETSFADLELTVQVRPDSGEEDQGGGPIWRCRDENNYYICRFNPLESNFRVYVVADGKRRQLASTRVETRPGRWYEVRVRMLGQQIECWLNGRHPLRVTDDTLRRPGRVGLWTKADAVTSFDSLQVLPLGMSEPP
jgi:hypothetical protein